MNTNSYYSSKHPCTTIERSSKDSVVYFRKRSLSTHLFLILIIQNWIVCLPLEQSSAIRDCNYQCSFRSIRISFLVLGKSLAFPTNKCTSLTGQNQCIYYRVRTDVGIAWWKMILVIFFVSNGNTESEGKDMKIYFYHSYSAWPWMHCLTSLSAWTPCREKWAW